MDQLESFFDVVTVIWVITLFLAFSPVHEEGANMLSEWLLPVFALEFIHLYRKAGSFKKFLGKHWLGLILVFPWFRIFKVVGLLKVARISQDAKIAKILESKPYETGKEFAELGRTVHEKHKEIKKRGSTG